MATGIYWPQKLPCWLLDSHEGQDEDIYARTDVDYGPARLRRMYHVVPHIRKAKIFLHGAEPALFHDFFENDILAGARRFIAPFRAIGGEDRYFEAEFVEPYDAEFVLLAGAQRAWRVSCAFRLYGEGLIIPPVIPPAILSATMSVHLRARGEVTPTASLAAQITVPLRARMGFTDLGGAGIGVLLRGRYEPKNPWAAAIMVALAGRVG